MLHLFHLNDTETATPRDWARICTLLREKRSGETCDLFLHGGDMVLGHERGGLVAAMMARLGFDGVAVGNHDLDLGLEAFARHAAELGAPALCANALGAPCFAPFRIVERQGVCIALTGVTLGDLHLHQPDHNLQGVALQDPRQAMKHLVPELRRQADLVVVLSHCGLQADMDLARAVPGIDLIVGGHSHHALVQPVQVGQTTIVQAGAYCTRLGWVRISRTEDGWQMEGELLNAEGVMPDATFLASVPALPEPGESPVIGFAAVDLRTDDYACETPLGNLTADLLRQYAGTDLALIRCAGVSITQAAGPIRQDDVGRLSHIPLDRIVRVELTGEEIRRVLECGTRDAYYLLTTSGAAVVYDGGRPPGQRVAEVRVGADPLDDERRYSVACTEIMARGAAGFTPLQGKAYSVTPYTMKMVLEDHIRTVGTIRPELDGRLVIRGELPREKR